MIAAPPLVAATFGCLNEKDLAALGHSKVYQRARRGSKRPAWDFWPGPSSAEGGGEGGQALTSAHADPGQGER